MPGKRSKSTAVLKTGSESTKQSNPATTFNSKKKIRFAPEVRGRYFPSTGIGHDSFRRPLQYSTYDTADDKRNCTEPTVKPPSVGLDVAEEIPATLSVDEDPGDESSKYGFRMFEDSEGETSEEETDESFDPQPRFFGQRQPRLELFPPIEVDRLEYYQAYPHNRGAALCEKHFHLLAMKWYCFVRNLINEQPDVPGWAKLLPRTSDGNIMSAREFAAELSKKIRDARWELMWEIRFVETTTGNPPLCELSHSVQTCLACENLEDEAQGVGELHTHAIDSNIEFGDRYGTWWAREEEIKWREEAGRGGPSGDQER